MIKIMNKTGKFILSLSLLLLIGYLAICSISLYIETNEIKKDTEEIKIEIDKKLEERAKMENILDDKNINEYLEERAREELGYVMPNEKVFYVVE